MILFSLKSSFYFFLFMAPEVPLSRSREYITQAGTSDHRWCYHLLSLFFWLQCCRDSRIRKSTPELKSIILKTDNNGCLVQLMTWAFFCHDVRVHPFHTIIARPSSLPFSSTPPYSKNVRIYFKTPPHDRFLFCCTKLKLRTMAFRHPNTGRDISLIFQNIFFCFSSV